MEALGDGGSRTRAVRPLTARGRRMEALGDGGSRTRAVRPLTAPRARPPPLPPPARRRTLPRPQQGVLPPSNRRVCSPEPGIATPVLRLITCSSLNPMLD
jgi:hypothetical protein